MRPAWKPWLLGFLAWTVLALLSTSDVVAFFVRENRPFFFPDVLGSRLINWYSCGIFTPLFFAVTRRWPIEAATWLRHGPIHLALCAGASVIKFAIEREALIVLLGRTPPPLGEILERSFISENIAFWCMAGVVHALVLSRRIRERELHSARLQARLSQAQLESLAARLHPHFLFNTLQGISTLVHRDPRAADAMLGHLSNLLRQTLQTGRRHEVTLAEELGMLEEYLAIALARFGDRLIIEREVHPSAEPGLVPRMVLQPLLENSFEHGVARKAGPARVALRATKAGPELRITVTDDGHGPDVDPPREGVGLGTTRARLAELYGPAATLTVAPGPGGGTVVSLVLPWHTEPVAPGEEAPA